MDVSVLATPTSQPACWDAPEVFSSLALDYDPRDEDYAHLDAEGHAKAAEARRKAEEAAVNVCYDCPLMLACEEKDAKAMAVPGAMFVHGVIGGLTEDERLARLGRRRIAASTLAPANPQIAPGDRGPRKQVDDALVARLTIAGKTGDQIARDLQCSVRTVTRARKRMADALGAAADITPAVVPATAAVVPTPAAVSAVTDLSPVVATPTASATAVAAMATPSPRSSKRTSTARPARTSARSSATTDARHPFLNGRPISAAMEAVYDHLSRNGGTSFEDLKALAATHIDDNEAMEWWLNRNSTLDNGTRSIRPSKAAMSEAERIREGAMAKAHNSIDAAVRAGRYLSKQDATVTLLPAALNAWRQRMSAAATA